MEASLSPSVRDSQLLPRTSGNGFRTQSRVGKELRLTTVKSKDTEGQGYLADSDIPLDIHTSVHAHPDT